jgi:hypothetical protein
MAKRHDRLSVYACERWADSALSALAREMEQPRETLFEACERAWRRAAAEWVDAEQRRTGKPVRFS